jgi:ATP-dependent helicase/nuclease subunit A
VSSPRASRSAAARSARTNSAAATAPAATWPNVVIRASAGSGKTFQLSNRYLQLVGAGVRPEAILAATFARKAAGEILARVMQRLADGALDDEKCAVLAGQVGWTLDRAGCGRLLGELLHNLHRLRIGTLDSFFVRLAGSFTLELGLPSDWRIVETLDDAQWRLEAIRRVLAGGKTAEILALVHLLFKGETTRSISGQVNDLVTGLYDVYCESAEPAWHGLKRPARLKIEEMAAAIESLAAATPPSDKRFADAWSKSLVDAQREDWETFLSKGLAKAVASGEGTYFKKPIEPELVERYQPLVKHAAGVLVGQIADQTEATFKLLAAFATHYQRLQSEQAGLMFSDVPRLLATAMEAGLWDHASWRLDGSISHLLVDEFQDTSLAQWRVLRPLATACCQTALGRSFFSVGDVKQAIYRWRGGVSQIFDAARDELPGVDEESLSTSRRSCQTVIDLVNRVFGGLEKNAALADFSEATQAWQAGFVEHSTAQTDLAGYVNLSVSPLADDRKEQPDTTLKFATERIAQLVANHPTRSIGVLVRTNGAVRQVIHSLRGAHQILASEEGGNPLVDSPAVLIALSALTLADHPGDKVARFHIAHSPLAKVLGVVNHEDDLAAHQAMDRLRRQLVDEGYGRTLYAWAQALSAQCDDHDLRRLEQLVALGYTFGKRAGARPSQFVRFVEETKVEDPAASLVRVMTVHQAKGLEFDIVVLPQLDKPIKGKPPELAIGRPRPIDPIEMVCRRVNESLRALLPARFQQIFEIWPREAVGESLCLLYVAVTRAVHAVHMIVAPTPVTKSPGKIPKTFAGIIRSALTDGGPLQPEAVAFEHGTPRWDREPASRGIQPSKPTKTKLVRLRTSGKVRHWERRSPSELEGGALVRAGDVLRADSANLARGSLWHAWLEKIEWLEEPTTKALDKSLFRSVDRSLTAGLDIEAELARFWKSVVLGPIGKFLTRSAYDDPPSLGLPAAVARRLAQAGARVVVERERRFAQREADALVSGSLDRLVTWQTVDGKVLAADVIDFKTDRAVDDGRLQQRVEFYRPQVMAYRRAVERLFGLESEAVVGRLMFLEAGQVRVVA